jgi:hypothetical protein
MANHEIAPPVSLEVSDNHTNHSQLTPSNQEFQQLRALIKDGTVSNPNVLKPFGDLELYGGVTPGHDSEGRPTQIVVETTGRNESSASRERVQPPEPLKKDSVSPDGGPQKEVIYQWTLSKPVGKVGQDGNPPKAGPAPGPNSRRQGIAN